MKNALPMGIVRNKFSIYEQNKKKMQRRKNRFKVMEKDQSLQQSTPRMSEMLLTSASTNSVESLDNINISQSCQELYQQARQKISKVGQLQKKMSNLSKARLTSFKQKQNQRHDEQIAKLASEATTNLAQSQKILKKLSKIEVNNDVQVKLIKNVQLSLAQQIRQCSKSLRQQQRQYYNTIRNYQHSTSNKAIQLTQQQKKIMFSVQEEMMIVQKQQDAEGNNKIHELVQSINKLSGIYKQLNNLVIEQGTLIDRIDYNIEETFQHTKNAVVHLQAANEHASNAFADRVIKVLVILILSMAFILGLKYMN